MRVLHKYDLPGIRMPSDVVIDRAGDIWCLHGNGEYQLTKLTRTSLNCSSGDCNLCKQMTTVVSTRKMIQ